jgi:acetylornithine deacetylase
MMVPRGDAVALLRDLVRLDSRNPSLVKGGPGESAVASRLAAVLEEWGMEVRLQEALPGRPNVIATVRGRGRSGRSLMLNGHLDVVGVEGMAHPPFDAVEREGRVFGRGASDMKGGVAAMCAAAARVGGRVEGDVIVTAVIDEEWQSAGTAALIAAGVRADGAVVTEPTRLAIMPAHKGFAWIRVTVHGRAAHGSRWDIGVDAIRMAGLLLAELHTLDSMELAGRAHPLLGRPSLHASEISGGIGWSTYPDRCVVLLERRTIPGESADIAREEVQRACAKLRETQPGFAADAELIFSQPPSDVPRDAPIVAALARSVEKSGRPAAIEGMSAWTDAALLNAAGIPAICFGPGDMGLAHAAEEYIDIRELELATGILVDFATDWCG